MWCKPSTTTTALSETEKAQGYTLMCCHTAASSELTLELLEAGGPQDIPEQQIVTQVRAITTSGTQHPLLHLQTPRTHRLRFLAGQSVHWAGPARCRATCTHLGHWPAARVTTATCCFLWRVMKPMRWRKRFFLISCGMATR
jgi:hypothetical protein